MAYQDTSLVLAQPVKNNLYLAAPPDERPAYWQRKKWARRLLGEFDLDMELFPDVPAARCSRWPRPSCRIPSCCCSTSPPPPSAPTR
jgi:hypothetical protein